MSEFQYVAFRAIDRPVEGKNFEYMKQQSSRAKITPWSFDNEYHFGDFRGNAAEMLPRGYDIHLHYANFGIRRLLIRFPCGLPNSIDWRAFFIGKSLCYTKDREGRGGALCIEPSHEPGDLEELWELEGILERLVPLRAEIMDGDPRPLYLANLAVARDSNHDPETTREAPVPAGLAKLSDAQSCLAELYGLDASLLAAAARESPPAPTGDRRPDVRDWLQRQPEALKNDWLAAWLADPNTPLRNEILADCRGADELPAWPLMAFNRTIAQLEAIAEEVTAQSRMSHEATVARARANRLAKMAKDPSPTLRETERLVAERNGTAYRQVAELLSELREVLRTSGDSALAERQAEKLKAANPTLKLLTSELRRHGFLPK